MFSEDTGNVGALSFSSRIFTVRVAESELALSETVTSNTKDVVESAS